MHAPAETRDGVRFRFEKAVGEAIGGNAETRHAARVVFLFENVDANAAAKQVIGAVEPRGTRPDDGNGRRQGAREIARGGFLKEIDDRFSGVVRRETLQILDRHGRVDATSHARLFAGANAHSPAGADEGVVLEQNGGREFRMTVADVVDVARHFDVRGAGFDAGGGGDLVMVARAAGDRRRVTEVVKKVIDCSKNRRGRRQADPAQARFRHQSGHLAHVRPVDRFAFAVTGLFKRFGNEHRTRAAGRATPARETTRFAVVAVEDFGERCAQVENKKPLRTRKARHGVAGIETLERPHGHVLGRRMTEVASVVVHATVPDTVDKFVHRSVSSGDPRISLFWGEWNETRGEAARTRIRR